jgi:hypothetical protein
MLGYAWSDMPDPFPWRPEHYVGIRIHRGWTPAATLFHERQPVVFCISPTRTVAAHGHFSGNPHPLDPPEHGCHLAICYSLDGYIPSQQAAPLLADHLELSVRQGSYRGLHRDELGRLVAAIRAHSAYVAL